MDPGPAYPAPSHALEDDGGSDDGKRKKGKRRKVNHACLYCRRSHMTCDEGRPCQRCIKREIGHLCHDDVKPAMQSRPKTPEPESAGPSTAPTDTPPLYAPPPHPPPAMNYLMPATTPSWPLYPPLGQFQAPETFGNEFASLTAILDSLDDPNFYNLPSFGVQDPPAAQQLPLQEPMPAPPSPEPEPEPVLRHANKTEQFLLTAADQASGSRNERLNRVIHAKYEAGLLRPYNYVHGYARLSRWMENHVSPEARMAILQPLSVLRPKFRAVAQGLRDIDLVLVEESFERLLLDYDRVFSAMAIPACLWRRTGEIYKANREFAELVGIAGNMLRDGHLCIYELMAEESAVNYWQKFGQVAFDTSHKAVLTSCVLRQHPHITPQGQLVREESREPQRERYVNCCCSFTIRRDDKGIPSMIVGNFIKY